MEVKNLTKAHSYRVWTNLGITHNIHDFMNVSDWTQLQELCRYFYETAVGRIHTRHFMLRRTLQLVQVDPSLPDFVLEVRSLRDFTNIRFVPAGEISFTGWVSTQIGLHMIL